MRKFINKIEGFENIEDYVSLAQAARENNIPSYSSISRACKSHGKSHGFKWQFID